MALTQVSTNGIKDATIATADIANDAVDGTKLANNIDIAGTLDVTSIATFDDKVLLGTSTEGHTSADNLTVADSGASGITIRSGTSSQGSLYFSDATSGGGEAAGWIRYDHSGNDITLGTGESERMRIDSNGKVGIGLTAPNAKLGIPAQASGDGGLARFAIESSVDDNDFSISQYEDGSGTYTLIGQNIKLNSSGNNWITDSGHRTAAIMLDARNSGSLTFFTGDTNANAEVMRIDKTGAITVGARASIDATNALARFGIDCQDYDALASDANNVENYGLVFYNSPTSNEANGIGFFNDSASNCGGYIVHQDKGANNIGDLVFGTASSANTPVERMRIDSSGKVGIGTSAPADYYADHLVVDTGSSEQSGITIVSDSTKDGMFCFADGTSGNEAYRGYINYDHNTDQMTLAASGTHQLLLESSKVMTTVDLKPNANGTLDLGASGAQWADIFCVDLTESSDRKWKKDIVTSDLGLSFINKLKPVSYKRTNSTSGRTHYGFIAQEVEQALIDIGKTTKEFGGVTIDNEDYFLRFSQFIAPLTKAIQELSAKVSALEAK